MAAEGYLAIYLDLYLYLFFWNNYLFRINNYFINLRFVRSDIEFLEEYHMVMEPIACSLDLLQSEKSMYFGYLIPTVEELIHKYTLFNLDSSISMKIKPLVNSILNGIKARFENVFNDKFLTIAAISHPKFKTAWIKNDVKKQLAIEYFKNACTEEYKEDRSSSDDEFKKDRSSPDDDFFNSWSKSSSEDNKTLNIEIDQYLGVSPNKNLECLNSLPTVKSVFRKYNTPLPSSASVERVFSIGGATMTKRRTNMTDDNFEKIMILKCNKNNFN
ncbi:uncharacterized protein LOC126909503 [Daktulosphaira vitifoliae]|uniref:uncharacterized protein LOC126909503 n=1 Tax=Daktulosphaira vitifoliae TaxID=58002 RepID=UPI0021AAB0C9|nr:uncharacterized protein LOC126909503 [Daktulosphaira vitifoliae]